MEPRQPHYLKLKQFILQRVTSGDWPPSSRIPSENELVQEFSVSRMTVNRALRELTAAGVVTRVQGLGTFVAGPKAESAMFEVRSIRDEVIGRGQTHSVEVLVCERIQAPAPVAQQFELPSGSELFHSRLLHLADGQPLQLEDRFVNPACAPDYLAIDFQREIPHQYLMRVAPLQRTEHVIEAGIADRTLAKVLTTDVGAPLLTLSRRTWSRGLVASCVSLTHPASKYRFVGSFEVGSVSPA